MNFWVGVTDNDWFAYQAANGPDEVNFWQPSATPPFRRAQIGMPFLFKLRRPNNHVAGGGYFVTYSQLPLSLAWEVFGQKNGAATFNEFSALLKPLTRATNGDIGCTVLASPFFLPRASWIANPPGWSSNIVRGKMYDSEEVDGRAIWSALNVAKHEGLVSSQNVGEPREKYGQPIMVKPRLGQSSFRVMVTDAYKRRCAITGENTLIALEAAHIVPYSGDGSHDVSNGMLLRADFHRLFDSGLVSVTPDLKIKISPRIREAYFNGKAYYRLNDQPLSILPERPEFQPDRDRLDWHYKNRFQA